MAIQKIFLGTTTGDKTGTGAKAAGAIINSNFQYLENKLTNKDRVVIDNGFSQVASTVTIASGWQWFLDSVLYTNPADVVITFPLAGAGLQRIDHIVATTSNTFMRVSGLESAAPVAPLFAEGTIIIAFSVVTDSSVVELVFLNDISSKLDKGNYIGTAETLSYQSKIYENGQLQVFRKPGTPPDPTNPEPNPGDYCIGFVENQFINAEYLGPNKLLLTSYNI